MADTQQLIAELSQKAALVKAQPPRVYITRLLGVLVLYATVVQLVSGLRADLVLQLARPMFVLELIALTGLCLSAAMACVLVMYPDAYQKRHWLKLPVVFVVCVVGLLQQQLGMPAHPTMVLSAEAAHPMECTLSIAATAILPTALIFMLLRKGATLMPLGAGALAVVTSWSVSVLTLRLAEANDSIMHLLTWHYLPSIGFAVLGAWLGRVMLKW